jgi:hypothetical protein
MDTEDEIQFRGLLNGRVFGDFYFDSSIRTSGDGQPGLRNGY